MKKKIIIMLLIIMFFVTGCGKKNGNLVLVTEAGFAPYEYYSNGEIVGVDIDIAERIAEEVNMEIVIKDVAFDSIISEVKTGKSDIGAAGISYTEERAKEVDFTDNYFESKQVVIVKNNSYINSLEDIYNSKIAVQLGSVADSFITENYPDVELVREKKFLAAIQDLKDDKVDAVAMDEIPAQKLMTADMRMLVEPLTTDNYGMIVRKGNTSLLETANKVINDLKENGEIDRFMLEHMGIEERDSGRVYQVPEGSRHQKN